MDKYTLYDSIVSTTYVNIASLSKDDIILNNFNKDNKVDCFFLTVAFMVAYVENKKIYIKCSFSNYIKTLFKFYPLKEVIKNIIKGTNCLFRAKDTQEGINIVEISQFELQAYRKEYYGSFNEDLTMSIFDDIWDEYYAKKGKEK